MAGERIVRAGAGILLIARDTGRMLLALRSRWVPEPNVWAPPGGNVEPGETPERAARRELREELGYSYRGRLTPVFVFRSPGFRYHNFVGTVPHEFAPVLNDESDDARWFLPTRLPKKLHFGMKAMMNDLRERTMRSNPTPANPTQAINLVDALRALVGKTRAFSLSEYMRLEKTLVAAKPFPLPALRRSILNAMAETILDRSDNGERTIAERYTLTRKYSTDLVAAVEDASGVPIEALFVIASASLPKKMRKIDSEHARLFGNDAAEIALGQYAFSRGLTAKQQAMLSNDPIWEQDWLQSLVPARRL